MLTRLIYHSENHLGVADGKMIAELNAIMDTANRNNKRDGLTGALIFDTCGSCKFSRANGRRSPPRSAAS